MTGFATREFALAPLGVRDIFRATNAGDFPVLARSRPRLERRPFQRCLWNGVDAQPDDSCALCVEGMIAGPGRLAWEPQAVEAVP